MRKSKSGSSAIIAHRRDISIPVLSFDKGVCTVSNLKDEMPQNPIINESMAIQMMPRFWHGSRRMKNQRLKQSSNNNPSLSGSFPSERQLHGWSRKKKEALISGDVDALQSASTFSL